MLSLKKIGFGMAAGAFALVGATAANATTFPVGSPNFFITVGTPTSSFISAQFYNFYSTDTSFDDSFTFTIPQDGFGGGSVAVSVPTNVQTMTLSDLIINGTSYASLLAANDGLTASVYNIPIIAGELNTVRIIGFGKGTYSGNLAFQATAVPEPAAWAMMLAGFGLVGFAMRHRRANVQLA